MAVLSGAVQRLVVGMASRALSPVPSPVPSLAILPSSNVTLQEYCCSWAHQLPVCGHQSHAVASRSFATQATGVSEAEQQQQGQEKQQVRQPPVYRQIRARIFGEPISPTERTGRRVLARPLKGAELASWYFLPPRMPGTHNEEQEYVMLRKLNKRQKKKEEEADTKKKK